MKRAVLPLCLLVPAFGLALMPAGLGHARGKLPGMTGQAGSALEMEGAGLDGVATPGLRVLEGARHPAPMGQVRIRQRVIVRISPGDDEARARLSALQARSVNRTTLREVPHDNCVRVENIVGVQPSGDNRLLLFMENRNVLAATLDRSCSAEAFYSGFYVERAEDGRLCVRRDLLQSRAGASCAVEQWRRLVPADD
ncbi:MAG: hypothetical protein N2Z59_02835 [Alteraurantiacibacter sp.]|nr:hypothetical protein [Alteraurantiacibacter sp.]